MDLNSKIAIVTGASSGIGAEFCKMLVENGSTVYGLAGSKDKLTKLKSDLGEQFHPVTMDITNNETLEKWVNKTFDADHQPDILINNAGVIPRYKDISKLVSGNSVGVIGFKPRQIGNCQVGQAD